MHGYISVYSVLWCIEWCSLEVSFCPLAFVLLEHLLDLLQYAQTKRKKGTLSTFQNKNESKSMLHHITQWKSKMTFCGPLKWKLLKTVLISTLITSNDPPHKIQVISKGTVDICSYRVHNGSGHNDAFLESNWKQQVAEMHEKDAGSNLSQFNHLDVRRPFTWTFWSEHLC